MVSNVMGKRVSKSKVSKKVITILLILAILFTVASVAIIMSNNNTVRVIDEGNGDSSVNPVVESGKISLIINPNPTAP
ncbi:MAG: hypothetical protein ABH840_00760 [Nanoarchaeota archaeon]